MAPRFKKQDATDLDNLLRRDPSLPVDLLVNLFPCSSRTIYEHKRKINKEFEHGGVQQINPGGRPSLVTHEIRSFCLFLICRDPELTLDEVADLVFLEFDVQLHLSTICRLWKATKITWKKCHVVAGQRNQELIDAWNYKRRNWKAEQLVFVDESAFNEKTTGRKWGFAPIGVPVTVKRWLRSSDRWSVLPAYCVDGYLSPLKVHGGVTQEIFEEWLERDILPQCRRWPGDREILIMDNCSIHRSQRVIDMCTEKGVRIEYLPPYCPFLNPIEESFHDLKSWVRRHYKWANYGYERFSDFLDTAIIANSTGIEIREKARGHFRNTGYQFSED